MIYIFIVEFNIRLVSMLSRKSTVTILGLLSMMIMVLAFSQAGIADSHTGIVEIETETEYDGIEDGDQAISTVATIEAEQEIDELRIDISGSSNTFLDFESIEPSVQGEGIGISTGDNRGEYIVEDIEPGQSVSIQFDSYPKQLDQSETEAAVIQLSAENPRTLDYTTEPVADTSSSPFLQLQRTTDELASVQSDLDRMEIFDTVTTIGMAFGILIGLSGTGAALIFKRKKSEWKGEAFQEAANEVRGFQGSVNFSNSTVEQECRELISNLEHKSGGDPGSGPTTSPTPFPPNDEGGDGNENTKDDGTDDKIFD